MLTLEDCIALSDLTEEEIAAISEHEHIPEIVAIEYGNYLIHTPEGVPAIKRIILEDIQAARAAGNIQHSIALRDVLHHFIATHSKPFNRSLERKARKEDPDAA